MKQPSVKILLHCLICLKKFWNTNYRGIPYDFTWKCDWKACVADPGVVCGCSPVAVFLSNVNKLVCVRVWGAVVVRSLHFSVLFLAGWIHGLDWRMNERWTAGFGWSWRLCSLLRLLFDSLAVLLKKKSLVVLGYVLSDVFVLFFLLFFLHASSDLSSVSQLCHLIDPQGPMTTKNISKLLYSFTLSLASNHSLSLSLPLFLLFLSWLPLSVTATQWQNRALAVGAGLPVLAPPPPLPVPPPSL